MRDEALQVSFFSAPALSFFLARGSRPRKESSHKPRSRKHFHFLSRPDRRGPRPGLPAPQGPDQGGGPGGPEGGDRGRRRRPRWRGGWHTIRGVCLIRQGRRQEGVRRAARLRLGPRRRVPSRDAPGGRARPGGAHRRVLRSLLQVRPFSSLPWELSWRTALTY